MQARALGAERPVLWAENAQASAAARAPTSVNESSILWRTGRCAASGAAFGGAVGPLAAFSLMMGVGAIRAGAPLSREMLIEVAVRAQRTGLHLGAALGAATYAGLAVCLGAHLDDAALETCWFDSLLGAFGAAAGFNLVTLAALYPVPLEAAHTRLAVGIPLSALATGVGALCVGRALRAARLQAAPLLASDASQVGPHPR